MITLQIFAAFYMTGVIWLIQLIHYPAFAMIREGEFKKFHERHSRVMTVLVGPVMLAELGSALWLARDFEFVWLLNCGSVCVPFLTTFLISVPIHDQLGRRFDLKKAALLTQTNWIRTLAWSVRAVGFAVYLWGGGMS